MREGYFLKPVNKGKTEREKRKKKRGKTARNREKSLKHGKDRMKRRGKKKRDEEKLASNESNKLREEKKWALIFVLLRVVTREQALIPLLREKNESARTHITLRRSLR